MPKPNAKLRVLFIESGTELGGAQIALRTLLQNLTRSRIEPYFASLGFGSGPLPAQIEGLGIPVARFQHHRLRNPLRSASTVAGLAELVQRLHVDVVFCNSGHPLLVGRPAAALAGRPCVWWVHGYFPEDPLKGHWIALAERFLQADVLVANSQYTAGQLQRVFPEHGKISVIPAPVDRQRFFPLPQNGSPLRKTLELPQDAPIVGTFGRLHPFKGQQVFLEAARILRSLRVPCHFLLVGGTPFGLAPEYERSLRAYVEKHKLEPNVTFLGPRDDVNELMNACDVIVHSSVEPEPWGLVVAEAMAAGRAVVATAGGGPGEMIDDQQNGRLVSPSAPAQLARVIQELVENPLRRKQIGDEAQRRVAQWDGQSAAERMESVLSSCAHGRAA